MRGGMSIMASAPRHLSSQSAAAKCAACVHKGLGSERSVSPRAMRSISASERKCDMLNSSVVDRRSPTEPRRWAGSVVILERRLLSLISGMTACNARYVVADLLLIARGCGDHAVTLAPRVLFVKPES